MITETIAERMYRNADGKYPALSLSIDADIDNIKQVYSDYNIDNLYIAIFKDDSNLVLDDRYEYNNRNILINVSEKELKNLIEEFESRKKINAERESEKNQIHQI